MNARTLYAVWGTVISIDYGSLFPIYRLQLTRINSSCRWSIGRGTDSSSSNEGICWEISPTTSMRSSPSRHYLCHSWWQDVYGCKQNHCYLDFIFKSREKRYFNFFICQSIIHLVKFATREQKKSPQTMLNVCRLAQVRRFISTYCSIRDCCHMFFLKIISC